MERLYSINSPNGIGYNYKDFLELEKKMDDYYQFYIKQKSDPDSEWYNYIFETKPGICCNCNKNLSIETNNTKIKYKLLYFNTNNGNYTNITIT